MIPGLEYESANGAGGDPSYAGGTQQSPSAQSIASVDMSPQNYNSQDSYHVQQLHRRRPHQGGGTGYSNGGGSNGTNGGGGGAGYEEDKYSKRKLVKKLDFFPKTESDYTVRTERGGQLTAVGYVIMAILILAEWMTWRGMNGESLEHIVVDTR